MVLRFFAAREDGWFREHGARDERWRRLRLAVRYEVARSLVMGVEVENAAFGRAPVVAEELITLVVCFPEGT